MFVLVLTALCTLATLIHADFPPQPEGITIKRIGDRPGVSISYKQTSICETKARGFAGYVHLPPSEFTDEQRTYTNNASLFFWYFEARNSPRTAATVIYLAGGPGQSSVVGATQSGGPCTILANANGTRLNEYAFNNDLNVLYVDQPVGTGFSYDKIQKGTRDLLDGDGDGITPLEEWGDSPPLENATFLYGAFSSQDSETAPNSTVAAAHILWQFNQVWFTHFPEYVTNDKTISFWGNSYAGYWVPASAEYTLRQNERIANGEITGTLLRVNTIGWSNGCADFLYQGESFAQMAFDNTYDVEIVDAVTYEGMEQYWSGEGGCSDLIIACRANATQLDPGYLGSNLQVNGVCTEAYISCAYVLLSPYYASNRSLFDIAQPTPRPFSPGSLDGFFNRGWVQKDLGVQVNFSAVSNRLVASFQSTSDAIRQPGMTRIEYLLDRGVQVHVMYGDRDYQCNWIGGEQLTLQANWSGAERFRDAGYQYIYSGDCSSEEVKVGVVRQHGNLSFSRVFEAGHDVAAYRPQIAFQIFNRALTGRDIASGKISTRGASDNYSTQGPNDSRFIRETPPPSSPVTCNIYNIEQSCTDEQYKALVDGTAEIVDFAVVQPPAGSPKSPEESA